jgi:hypothetical protein
MAISKKKVKNLPESPKNLDDFNSLFINFFENFQEVPLTSSSGLFFFFFSWQNGEFVPQKKSLIYPCQTFELTGKTQHHKKKIIQ